MKSFLLAVFLLVFGGDKNHYLRLFEKLELTNGRSIEYVFAADGQKLRKTIEETGKADFVVDYMGELLYHNGRLVSIDTDEGRATPLDSLNQSFNHEFFYNDHLGNLRVSYSVAPDGAYITQENHFGPTGELLEGISFNSDSYPYLFQGKEREFSWGIDLDDFHSRMYGSWEGRMWQIDGADQFASGYVGMGNNAVNGTDPDGQWVHIAIGAAIGGLANLGIKAYQGKIRNFSDGLAAFGIGAVAGGITAATGGAGAVYASTGSFAGAFSATAVAASSTGFLGGAIAGTVGSAFGSGVQGVGNAAYFGDPYSARQYGQDILLGGIMGGVGGAIAAWAKGLPPLTGGNNYPFLQRPTLGGNAGRVIIEPLTGEFPAVTNPITGKTTQTTFDVGGANSTSLRKVGSVLESIDDVMANPNLLIGKSPLQVEGILGKTSGWRVETLGQGSQKGNGWVLRQFNPKGNPTGPQLRWHPGGGHHGPNPYWRVVGPNGGLGGIIR